jgi:hypothetical protein
MKGDPNYGGTPMQKSKLDWRREKLLDVFQRYHSAIRARSNEGRQYAMRCFYSVLTHEGLRVEKLGPAYEKPFDSATGAGYLLVEKAIVLDVVCTPHITTYTLLKTYPQIPWADLDVLYKRYVFNFGSATPEWYPRPMTAAELKVFLRRRWTGCMPNPKVSLAQPPALEWEAPYVQ